jgi:oligopeptide transport system substrate-binding protein
VRRRPVLPPLLLALTLAFAGASCTNDAQSAGPQPTLPTLPTESSSPTPSASPEATPTGEVFTEADQVLKVAIPDPATLDPMRIQDPGSTLIARQLFEGLTRWDPQQEAVVPAAARSWKVTRRGRVFTFKLRGGMTFHDGTPVTARDFEFAFNRIADKKNASDLAYTLELVDGFVAFNQLGRGKKLRGITAPNDRTLVIELSEPLYDFPAVLTHPGLVPVSKDSVKDIDEFLRTPVGNGPFEIAKPWTPGDEVVLGAFEDFYEPPALDGIEFIPFVDAAESWIDFDNGDLDVAEVPVGQIEPAAETYGDDGYKPLLAGYYFGLNVRSKALENVRLRLAINHAIDRAAIATDIYRDNMLAPRGIVPTGLPGFSDSGACEGICEYRPRTAARIVSRLPRRARRIRLDFTAGKPHAQVARAVKADLEEAGLEVKIESYGFTKYLRRLRAGKQQMYRLGWIAEFPVPDVFLSSLFESDAPDNHSGFDSRRVDSLLRKAHAESSELKRVELYRKAERTILKQAPIVPLGSFVTHWAAQPRVEGIDFDVMGGFDAAGISLSNE